MTREEVKNKLKGYRDAQRRLEIAERELEVFESKLTPSIDYSKPRVGGGKASDIADIISKLAQMHDRVKEEYLEASRQLVEVKKLLESVDDEQSRDILSRRYISCQHWKTISIEMRLDWRWMFRLHNRALDELAKEVE